VCGKEFEKKIFSNDNGICYGSLDLNSKKLENKLGGTYTRMLNLP
jgi:hypothetical protein